MVNRKTELSDAMGWREDPEGCWYRENHPEDSTWSALIFDPVNDPRDTEKVIAWLIELGWEVEIQFHTYDLDLREKLLADGAIGEFGADVHIWNRETEQHERIGCDLSCWKRCLSELATTVARRQDQA